MELGMVEEILHVRVSLATYEFRMEEEKWDCLRRGDIDTTYFQFHIHYSRGLPSRYGLTSLRPRRIKAI